MRKITFHEEADSEVYEAALYYEERANDLGLAFLDEVEKTSQRILANPMAYRRVGGEVRQALVARFPYSILYVIEPDECIRVIAVAHQKRRPGYWWKRLQIET
jgi:plasmid stabilization system protein ParE